MRDGDNKVYKSLLNVIEGKEGRFRKTLLPGPPILGKGPLNALMPTPDIRA
jgi:hypothetical protein